MGKSGRSEEFPQWTGCTFWFFIMSAGNKLNCAFILSSGNNINNKKLKNPTFKFLPKLQETLIELARFGVQMLQNGGGAREHGHF